MKRIRWKIADFIHWFYGDKVCWPRLVMWAEFILEPEELWYCFSSIKQCEKERYDFGLRFGSPTCYCGKGGMFPEITPKFMLFGR